MKSLCKLGIIILLLTNVFGCGTLKYEKAPPINIPKVEKYVLPTDPFEGSPPPVTMLAVKVGDFYQVTTDRSKATHIIIAPNELNKLTLRLQYYKELVPALVSLVNVRIDAYNASTELVSNLHSLKELYRQLYYDVYNKNVTDNQISTLEKGGLLVIAILALIAAL